MLKKLWQARHLTKQVLRINKRFSFNKQTRTLIDLYRVKPNLIILGSQKCGTTSLHVYLGKHPDIFMSSPFKEPGYFIFEQWAKSYWEGKGIKIKSKKELIRDYMLKGYAGQKYFGDSSTYYTQNHRERMYDIPQAIKNETKSPKFLYLIRNPFDRLISIYYHQVKYNGFQGSMEALLSESDSYVNTTLYYSRLEYYLSVFEKKDFLILQFEELIREPQQIMSSIYQFLGLPDLLHEEFKQHNKTSPASRAKIPIQVFRQCLPLFEREKELLEKNFGMKINWDLKPESWTALKE
jgi:hypothetical protein